MELFRIKKDIPFMSYGRLTTAISLITFILAVFFLATKGLHYGVDFTGGTVMEVNYPQAANIDSIRKAVDSHWPKRCHRTKLWHKSRCADSLAFKERNVDCPAF